MKQSLSELVPVELKDFTLIREWQVAGPFDLGIRERIPVNKDSSLYVPELMKAQEPERDWDINQTYSSGSQIIAWQKAKTNEREWVDLDAIYGGDFVFAYGFSHIYSPKDQLVLADIWADDVTRAFVNGQEAVFFLGYNDWYHPHYFLMPLKKGWNAVLIKNGDTYKAWGFAVRIFDPNSKLRFSSQAPE